MARKIKKGDQVIVIAGDDKGKIGKIIKVLPEKEKAIVEGVNIVKRHRRFISADRPHGIVEMPAPIHLSNLALICPSCGKKTSVGFRFEGEKKVRFCKKCKESIDKV
ncbi:MAG: 50S ribosomal protein L24 [Candidatus Hydrothermales bacterium]